MSRVKSRRELYSEATRSALLEVATRMFAERGFARTSLEDVAVAIQATRGAVYHHFDSKQALFEAVLEDLERHAVERIAAAAAGHDDAWDAALAGLDAYLDECCDPTYGRLSWQEGPVALGWTRWMECAKKYGYGCVERFMHATAEAGYLPPAPLPTLTGLVFNLLAGAGHAIAEAPAADKRQVRDECADLMGRMLSGLRVSGSGPRRPAGT